MELFGIYDKKAMCYLSILAVNNKVQAYRAFESEVNSSNSLLNKYPSDFALHFLGSCDDKTGKIVCPDLVRVDLEASACLINFGKPSGFVGASEVCANEDAASSPAANERRIVREVKL